MPNLLKPRIDSIPRELADCPQWVVWRAKVITKKNGTKKTTKIPINPKTGNAASTQKRSHWATFEEAVDAYQNDTSYSGIGFVFSADDPFVGIDIDDCLTEEKKIKSDIKSAIATVRSFTERSPSGKGLHIICKGELPGAGHCDKANGREMYQEGRFFTITGITVGGLNKVVKNQTGVDNLYDHWFGESFYEDVEVTDLEWDDSAKQVDLSSIPVTDQVKNLISNGEGMDKFVNPETGDEDRSLALFYVTREMIYAGANKESVLTILSDEENYLSSAALDRRSSVKSARDWLWKYTVAKVYVRYTQEMALFDDDDEDSDDDEDEVETSSESEDKKTIPYQKNAHELNAVLFLKKVRHLIRHNKQYYSFNGKYYRAYTEDQVERDIAKSMRGMDLPFSTVNNTITTVKRFSTKDDFQPDSNLICFQNGVMDLSGWNNGSVDLELKPHDRKYKITSILDFEYDPTAKCPNFRRFLKQISNGEKDHIRSCLQILGYSLVYDNRFQKIFLFQGKSRAGKGVLTNTVLPMLIGRESYAATTLSNLAGDHGLAQLLHKKVAVIGDAHKGKKDSISRSKEVLLSISGNDMVAINPKHKDEITTQLPCRIIMNANDMPWFADGHDALSNRYQILKFNVSFAGREDVDLPEKLKSEIAGIFNLVLKSGLLDLGKRGFFVTPESSLETKEEIAKLQNPVRYFIDKFLIKDKSGREKMSDVYDYYVSFAHVLGVAPKNKNWFGRSLRDNADWIKDGRMTTEEGRDKAYLGVSVNKASLDDFIENGDF